jgi:hypothetical protein
LLFPNDSQMVSRETFSHTEFEQGKHGRRTRRETFLVNLRAHARNEPGLVC